MSIIVDLINKHEIEMRGHSSNEWKPVSLQVFLQSVSITMQLLQKMKNQNPEEYEEERALWNLGVGRQINTPLAIFRLASGEVCTVCQCRFIREIGALSRKDNETYICSDCGINEGLLYKRKNK